MWTNILTGGALILVALFLTGQAITLHQQSKDYSTWGCLSFFAWLAIIGGAIGLVTKFLVQHNLRWLFMFIGIIAALITIYEIYLLSHDGNNQENRRIHKIGITIFAVLTLVFGGWYAASPSIINAMSPSSDQDAVGGYQQLGHKIKKSEAKEEKDGSYYTDKTDKNIRYFTDDDGTITAIKYSYMPDPEHTTAVISEMDNLLDDSNLKYGNDKVDKDKTLLKGDNYNVYSPKHKKWYHMSMLKDDDGKVSTFSIWPGKDSDAE